MVIFTTMLFLSTALLLLASASAGCEPNDVNPDAVRACVLLHSSASYYLLGMAHHVPLVTRGFTRLRFKAHERML